MQRTRLVNISGAPVEIVHTGGHLPGGRELVSRITTDLRTNSSVYTEASGSSELYARASQRRGRSVAQNYHALVQSAALRDESVEAQRRQLSLVVRRTMGIASLADGAMEYMLMRRLTDTSDNQGPWPLDDRDAMSDIVRLRLATVVDAEQRRFIDALELEHPLVQFYDHVNRSSSSSSRNNNNNNNNKQQLTLPTSVWAELLVRLDAPLEATFMVRLQNVVATGAPPVRIPSLALALGMDELITACVETTLTMQQTRAVNDIVRLRWRTGSEKRKKRVVASGVTHTGCTDIVLDPLDIRTFTFTV